MKALLSSAFLLVSSVSFAQNPAPTPQLSGVGTPIVTGIACDAKHNVNFVYFDTTPTLTSGQDWRCFFNSTGGTYSWVQLMISNAQIPPNLQLASITGTGAASAFQFKSGTTSNTDVTGRITITNPATTGSYNFQNPTTTTSNCTIQPTGVTPAVSQALSGFVGTMTPGAVGTGNLSITVGTTPGVGTPVTFVYNCNGTT